MKYHVAFGRFLDLERIDRESQNYQCPRNGTVILAQQLGATIHQPGKDAILPLDKLRAKLAGRPDHWALARKLSSQLTADDLIFCTGEDVGIPVAMLCGPKRERPQIAMFVHNMDRPRGYLTAKLFRLREYVDLFITNAQPQAEFLRHTLRLPESRIYLLQDHTDTDFFTPGPCTMNQDRSIVASVGLEKRDYFTLAAATQDLAVDVNISGFSQDVFALAQVFPKNLPTNMKRQFYEWPDLVQLYRAADLVVVSMVENKFCAGLTAMLEAMACCRPVIITRTKGLQPYLMTPGIATVIDPGNAMVMKQAIIDLLSNPLAAKNQAQQGYEHVVKQHNMEKYVQELMTQLISISGKIVSNHI